MKPIVILAVVTGALSSPAAAQTKHENIRYVALGSSFAAGLGLGETIEDAPKICMRGRGSYPQILAQQIGADMADVSCSGSTASQILNERQAGLPPQIEAVTAKTDLVTITVGGNDLGYAGDMMRAAGWFGGLKAPLTPADERPYGKLKATISAVLTEVRRRAPKARIVLATYPDVVPMTGTCANLGLAAPQAAIFHAIADRLAATTRSAAKSVKGTILVDIARLSKGHDVCSADPWTTGGHPEVGFAFHPNAAGAKAIAGEIRRRLGSLGS